MITVTSGNLLRDSADVLVNPVNTVGVMGKGLALQFKRTFPDNFTTYQRAHQHGELRPGSVLAVPIEAGRWIVNFPTKRHWRQPSRLDDIADGLDDLRRFLDDNPVTSVAVPPLGCGNGGLPWPKVRKLVETKLASLDVTVRLYEPGTPAAEDMDASPEPPRLEPWHHYLLAGLERYLQQSWDAGIAMTRRLSLIEAHKVAYFLQRAGLDLRLHFDNGPFGPYAPQVNRFFAAAEGHYVRGYGDGTGGARADLWLLPDGKDIAAATEHDNDFLNAWKQVSGYTDGFEDPHGMELLASVDYLCREHPEPPHTPKAIQALLDDWNNHKREVFTAHHITVALNRLAEQHLAPAS